MWEWRIFFKETYSNELKFSREYREKLDNSSAEQRTDYYYDLSLPQLGLKERGSSHEKMFKPILELKVLLEGKDWGAELWKKIIKYPISKSTNPDQGLARNDIIEILEYEKKGSPLEDKIELIIGTLKERAPTRVKVQKNRAQIKDVYRFNHSRSMFKLERTHVNIFEKDWYSVCIESPNAQLLRQFIKNQILNIPERILAGYPSFISNQRMK